MKNKILYTIFLICTVIVVCLSVFKAYYWPPSSYDAIVGYDLFAKLITEGINPYTSNFSNDVQKSKIPPVLPIWLATWKLLGMNSQGVMSFFLIIMCVYFYDTAKDKIYAIICLFLVVTTPEFIAFQSIINSNTVVATLILGAVIYLNSFTIYSIILLSLAVLVRSDVIIFIPVFVLFKDKRLLIPIIPFGIWWLYLYFNGLSANVFGFPTWAKLDTLIIAWFELAFLSGIFGITFWAFVVFALKRSHTKEYIELLDLILLLFLANFVLYLFLDPDKMSTTYQHLLNASFKRSLFTFVPLCWYYVARVDLARTKEVL